MIELSKEQVEQVTGGSVLRLVPPAVLIAAAEFLKELTKEGAADKG